MSLRDREEFERGRRGEQAVMTLLQRRGCFIVPCYDFAGTNGDKAPRLLGAISRYAIPDLDVAKGGNRMWCEVKAKKKPTLHEISQVLEHGFAKRLFDGYAKVQAITGTSVTVWVVEVDSGDVIYRSLDKLGAPRVYPGDKMDKGGTIFWPRASFKFAINWRQDAELYDIMQPARAA